MVVGVVNRDANERAEAAEDGALGEECVDKKDSDNGWY